MKFNNKLLFTLGILVLLSMGLIIATENSLNSDREKRENYGQCVANATTEKYDCLKISKINYYDCLKNALNNTENRKELKNEIKKCRDKFLDDNEVCRDEFKLDKDGCLPYRCDYNSTDKIYLNKSPSFCKITAINCEFGYESFKDSCGCGCKKSKKIETRTCNKLRDTIVAELKLDSRCQKDSDCGISDVELPCDIARCGVSYNNNSNITNLLDLAKIYNDKNCVKVCPMFACQNPNAMDNVCDHGSCKLKVKKIVENKTDDSKKTYCTNESRQGDVCPMIYHKVCGWNDATKVQCFRYPCAQEYANECLACKNQNIEFYTDGNCPNKVPVPF